MSRLILLGNPGTKRTTYLEKGAEEAGIKIHLLEWEKFRLCQNSIPGAENIASGEKIFLKIDPPVWESCCLEELNELTHRYEEELHQIEKAGQRWKVSFLNEPNVIIDLLNKRKCKRHLLKSEIPVTEEITGFGQEKHYSKENLSIENHWSLEENGEPLTSQLLESMTHHRVFQVFIKPVWGSGAAGTAAFRFQPKTGNMALYTCAIKNPATGRLVNTKRLRKFTDRKEVLSMAEQLLRLDCVVERWYAKAEHKGFSYDLRAVVQDGRIDFILARLSKGPITNLHLNNHPLRWQELGLTPKTMDSIAELCIRAAGCYKGLRSVGIDILLEKGSLRPRIIEMNGQGDLIYQDIYNHNVIYRHQAEMMKECL